MVLHWEVSLWHLVVLLAGVLFLICIGITIGVVWKEKFAQEISPEDEHKYFPQNNVSNKNL